MKRLWLALPLVLVILGCTGQYSVAPATDEAKGYTHGQSMGGAEALKTDFATLDRNGNGSISPSEFKHHFPKVSQAGYRSLDLNRDGGLDKMEWGHFKKIHGVTRYPDNAV